MTQRRAGVESPGSAGEDTDKEEDDGGTMDGFTRGLCKRGARQALRDDDGEGRRRRARDTASARRHGVRDGTARRETEERERECVGSIREHVLPERLVTNPAYDFTRAAPFDNQPDTRDMTDTLLASDLRAGMQARPRDLAADDTLSGRHHATGVSWAAILAGATGAAALSLILLILGVGLGLSSVSPFAGSGASATTFGVSTIVWLTFTQLAASGIGGYLAGRLRTRWVSTHTDEVYFRDTAHGFLAWAIATLVTAATLTSAIGAIVGTGANAAGAVAGGAATTAAAAAPAAAGAMKSDAPNPGNGYFVDSLFRKDASAPATAASAPVGNTGSTGDSAPMGAEAGRIFANGLEAGALPPEDVHYLGAQVAQRTGLSQADAEKRVTDGFARMKAKADQAKADAKEAADKARKASAYAAMWLFISLLIGAFVASFSATFGGRQRDLV